MQGLKRMLVAVTFLGLINSGRAADSLKSEEKPVLAAKVALGTGIQDKELVGNATEFNISAGRVYCWSKITAKNLPTTVRHVWYADGQKIAEVPLSVKVSPTRTWSSKAIWAGKWKVEIVNESRGEILATAEFTVKG